MGDMVASETSTSNSDYDFSRPLPTSYGLKKGLAGYGDPHFSLFLRKVFIKSCTSRFCPIRPTKFHFCMEKSTISI